MLYYLHGIFPEEGAIKDQFEIDIVVNTDKHKSKPLPDLSDQVPPT